MRKLRKFGNGENGKELGTRNPKLETRHLIQKSMHTIYEFDALGVKHVGNIWTPNDNPKAVMAIVHGHGEHSARYAHVAESLNKKGIAVIAYDLYGHGKTGGKRGYTPSYEKMMDTIGEQLSKARNRFPDAPIFLYGHSMGGNLVANYVLKRDFPLKGVILSAPWFRLAFEAPKSDIILAKIMMRIYPKFTQSSKLETTSISRDPQEVKLYENDPLIHDQIGPPLALGCLDNGLWALEHAAQWKVPLLHYHGTGDKIISAVASKEFNDKVKGDNTWKAFEGYFHEPHNESKTDRAPVLKLLADWMLARV